MGLTRGLTSRTLAADRIFTPGAAGENEEGITDGQEGVARYGIEILTNGFI